MAARYIDRRSDELRIDRCDATAVATTDYQPRKPFGVPRLAMLDPKRICHLVEGEIERSENILSLAHQ